MIEVRGGANAEEIAALLAALADRTPAPDQAAAGDRYERWRAGRLAALRHTQIPHPPPR